MKIIRIIGGLGNQMFQYALYLALKERFPNEDIYLDYSLMSSYNIHNGLEINNVFNIAMPQASFYQLLKVTRPTYNYKLSRIVETMFPKRKHEVIEARDYTFNLEVFDTGNKYYRGYWQNYKYFINYRNRILEAFRFKLSLNDKTANVLKILDQQESVSVHIRRGDYLKAPNYTGLCGIEYYTKSIKFIKENVLHPHFYLFSDDLIWSVKNIVPLFQDSEYTIIDFNRGIDSPLDMLIMSRCNHNIIANSSFSWWAAFLNKSQNAIICAPEKWTNTKVNCKFQLPEWILF